MHHYMFCPRQINNPLHFQNQRYIDLFMSQRERDIRRERAREKETDKEIDKEKEIEKVQAIIFLNRPGQNEKSYPGVVEKRDLVCN